MSVQQSERLQKSDIYYDYVLLKTSAVCSRSSVSNRVKLRSKTQTFAADVSHYIACDSSGRQNAGTQVNDWTVRVPVFVWISKLEPVDVMHLPLQQEIRIASMMTSLIIKQYGGWYSHLHSNMCLTFLSWTVTFSYISWRSV